MIKAVIFDMDGVIIDSEPLWIKSTNIYFKKVGIEFPDKNSMLTFIDINFRGRRQKEVINILKKKFKLKGSYNQIMKVRTKLLLEVFDKELKLVPGILTLIKKFKKNNIPMVVASSSPSDVIDYAMSKFKLNKFFKEIISGDNVKESKPEPDIFIKAAKSFENVKTFEILVIEDSYSGVLAAKKAKMKCLGIRRHNALNKYYKTADKKVTTFVKINYNSIVNL
ncbi:MAG: HAD family hydrolase [Candidatus Kerfeldbacteria bacterium]|jgi:HAD superfamily hydrolase (TIGR01509 family)